MRCAQNIAKTTRRPFIYVRLTGIILFMMCHRSCRRLALQSRLTVFVLKRSCPQYYALNTRYVLQPFDGFQVSLRTNSIALHSDIVNCEFYSYKAFSVFKIVVCVLLSMLSKTISIWIALPVEVLSVGKLRVSQLFASHDKISVLRNLREQYLLSRRFRLSGSCSVRTCMWAFRQAR